MGMQAEPSYPNQRSRSRRDFLELLALGSVGVLAGLPAGVRAEEPSEEPSEPLFELMDLEGGYTLEFSVSCGPGAPTRKTLNKVRKRVTRYVAKNVTPNGMHDPVTLQGYHAALTAILEEVLEPVVLQGVSLGHNCRKLCPPAPRTRGARPLIDSDPEL
ncbi:MAG: hypothetical protein CO108_25310 [Deltaproteobacteria bacterium CG_4_9_14_3_um_filter_63_12]|nr:MAG: hypothetical protein CO108_25310 [Deltaproteobacteria bacterium CG_4_9_14_3_um_filter_63_12]